MLRFHFFTAKQGTWVHKDDRGPLSYIPLPLLILYIHMRVGTFPTKDKIFNLYSKDGITLIKKKIRITNP